MLLPSVIHCPLDPTTVLLHIEILDKEETRQQVQDNNNQPNAVSFVSYGTC